MNLKNKNKKYLNNIMENFVAIALGGKTKKNKKTNKKTRKVNCYAGRTKKENSCYTEESLLKLRDIWNKKHPDKKNYCTPS